MQGSQSRERQIAEFLKKKRDFLAPRDNFLVETYVPFAKQAVTMLSRNTVPQGIEFKPDLPRDVQVAVVLYNKALLPPISL